jgi:Putative auto-transporter adhesin, head GIN domain
MKQFLTILLIGITGTTGCFAQHGPLKGSGKVVNKVYDYTGFDKITLNDLDGKIEIEAGKAFTITIDIDDNLEPMLQVKNSAGTLSIALEGNNNNRKYIEDTHIKVKITLPLLSSVQHDGNTGLTIIGIAGKYFRLRNGGNGSAQLTGTIEELDIKNTGNGNVNARQLVTQQAMVVCRGNGNVYVNAVKSLTAKSSGNCSVINTGMAEFSADSYAAGNGRLMRKGE